MAESLFTLAQSDDDVLTEHLPAHLSREQLRATIEHMIANPIEPDVAAERILAAVETGRLYALTHGDFEGNVVIQCGEDALGPLTNQSWYGNHVATAGDA
jgi:hypothetical protein